MLNIHNSSVYADIKCNELLCDCSSWKMFYCNLLIGPEHCPWKTHLSYFLLDDLRFGALSKVADKWHRLINEKSDLQKEASSKAYGKVLLVLFLFYHSKVWVKNQNVLKTLLNSVTM